MTLTREEILAMEPGYYLDALIAEKIMGWTKFGVREDGSHNGWSAPFGYSSSTMGYSQIISAAWEVVEAMKSHKYGFAVTEVIEISHHYLEGTASLGDYRAMFRNKIEAFDATSKTAPEAICKAALLAVLNL